MEKNKLVLAMNIFFYFFLALNVIAAIDNGLAGRITGMSLNLLAITVMLISLFMTRGRIKANRK